MSKKAFAAVMLLVGAVVFAQAQAPAKPPSSEDALVVNLADAKWAAPTVPEIPPGLMGGPIAVDPKTGGPLGYAKFPPKYVFPMHWHSHPEYVVLISGKASFTLDGKTHQLSPGAYATIPAKAHHSVTCSGESECVILSRRGGPVDYHFVK
jgi:quercetin dioxygenase-like cupin family protein